MKKLSLHVKHGNRRAFRVDHPPPSLGPSDDWCIGSGIIGIVIHIFGLLMFMLAFEQGLAWVVAASEFMERVTGIRRADETTAPVPFAFGSVVQPRGRKGRIKN